MSEVSPQETKPFPLSADLIATEYSALRAELLKLTELQFQIIVVTLASFGTILTVGTQIQSAPIILAYPILALFFAMGWITHAHGIDMLGAYIQNKIELKVGTDNIGWENFSRKEPVAHSFIAFWVSRSPFVMTQLIALATGLAIAIPNINIVTILLALLGTACTGINIFVFIKAARTQGQGKRLSNLI